MSALEQLIWTVLGLATMPLIFLVGFAATAALGCFLLERCAGCKSRAE